MKTIRTMLKNELVMSLRGMDMPIFAIAMPLVILVILGAVFGQKPAFDGAEYTFLEQSFGGLATISICAGGVMGLPLLISDYRAKRILKRYHVTPVSPVLILFAGGLMYLIYAVVSLISLFAAATVFWGFRMRGSIVVFLVGWLIVTGSMFSIGILVGGIAKDAKTAGIIASALYFPMLVFSGATLPYEVMPDGMKAIVNILPLTHGIKILKCATLGLPMENIAAPVALMLVIAAVCSFIGIKFFKWE